MLYNIPSSELDFTIRNEVNKQFCEMSGFDTAFLCSMLRKYKPKNILEVGVAAGATSAIILSALKAYSLTSTLTSCDINDSYYRDSTKQTGFRAKELHPSSTNHKLFLGRYLPEIISENSELFDFVILDTAHTLPGELLDFLAILPYLSDRSIVVLHDLCFHMVHPYGYATKLIFDSYSGEKFLAEDSTSAYGIPNIGALLIDKRLNIHQNLFLLLSHRWNYLPSQHELDVYLSHYDNHYHDSYSRYFATAIATNTKIFTESSQNQKNMRKSLISNYLFLTRKLCNFDIFDRIIYDNESMNWSSILVSPDGNIHYEFIFGGGVNVCLHFAGPMKDKISSIYITNKNFLNMFISRIITNTSEYFVHIDDIYDIYKISSIMAFLINISFPLLCINNLASSELIVGNINKSNYFL